MHRATVHNSAQLQATMNAYYRLMNKTRFCFARNMLYCAAAAVPLAPCPACHTHSADYSVMNLTQLNSRQFVFYVIAWFDHPTNVKEYGCIDEAGREFLKPSERPRGKCDFYRKHFRPGNSHSSNEAWICNRSKDSHGSRRVEQLLGQQTSSSKPQQPRRGPRNTQPDQIRTSKININVC
jgi:hypothetical protein